jgi:hypothetical protein
MAHVVRFVRAAALATALPAAAAHPADGHPVSFTVAASKTAYASGDYGETDGDWRAEGVLRYESRGLLRAGLGVEVGKLDEPYSDPSFTAIGVFGEVGLAAALADRWAGLLAARYGWSHERVGEEEDGLWAWGWEAGVVAGVDYRVSGSAAIGLQADATRLSLRRDEEVTTPPSGLSRRGWRFGLGLTLRLGGR